MVTHRRSVCFSATLAKQKVLWTCVRRSARLLRRRLLLTCLSEKSTHRLQAPRRKAAPSLATAPFCIALLFGSPSHLSPQPVLLILTDHPITVLFFIFLISARPLSLSQRSGQTRKANTALPLRAWNSVTRDHSSVKYI